MESVTISYNEHNDLAKHIIHSIKQMGVFTVSEPVCPYDKEFMNQIDESRLSEGKIIPIDEIWK